MLWKEIKFISWLGLLLLAITVGGTIYISIADCFKFYNRFLNYLSMLKLCSKKTDTSRHNLNVVEDKWDNIIEIAKFLETDTNVLIVIKDI